MTEEDEKSSIGSIFSVSASSSSSSGRDSMDSEFALYEPSLSDEEEDEISASEKQEPPTGRVKYGSVSPESALKNALDIDDPKEARKQRKINAFVDSSLPSRNSGRSVKSNSSPITKQKKCADLRTMKTDQLSKRSGGSSDHFSNAFAP